jgi:hypothetical protein
MVEALNKVISKQISKTTIVPLRPIRKSTVCSSVVSEPEIGFLGQAVPEIDPVLSCRYEMKYFISETTAHAINGYLQSRMPLDKYSRREGGFYPISSLYLDSHNLQLCRESLGGLKNRFKLRIRSYTDDPDYPCFLEIKRRMDGICLKDRVKLDSHNLQDVLFSRSDSVLSRTDVADHETLRQFMLYVNSINASPVIKVRYMRKAYEDGSHNRVRVTFDRQLAFKVTNQPDISLNGGGWQRHCTTGVVLEIKFTGKYPAWIVQMIRMFNLQRQSFSKYARSIERSCLLRFCAPRVPVERGYMG